ncbi:MAG: GumC family protein [Sphingomonadaceae bacterium]
MATQQSEMVYSDRDSGRDYDDLYFPENISPGITSGAILELLSRQKWAIGGTLAVALIIGILVTLLTDPVYRATTAVQVDLQGANIVEGQDIGNPQITGGEVTRYLGTLGSAISGHSLALRVVDRLELASNPALIGTDQAGADSETRRQAAASTVMANVRTDIPLNSRIITITYSSPDPVLSARIANALADALLEENAQRSIEANAYARKALERQIEETRGRLGDAERQAIEYARRNRIVTPPGPISSGVSAGISAGGENAASPSASPTLASADMLVINQGLAEAKMRRISAEQRWRIVREQSAISLPEVQANPTVQTLQTRRAELMAQMAELRTRYQPGYPEVEQTGARISEINQQISTVANSIRQSIHDTYLVARREEKALSGELDRVSDRALAEQGRRVQASLLDRNAEALRTQLAALLGRYNQINTASNITTSIITRLDPAIIPSRASSPDIRKIMLIALFGGLVAGLGLGIMREILDDRIRTPEDVERKLGASLLGVTPLTTGSVAEELQNRHSPLAEACSTIRALLEFSQAKTDGAMIVHATSSAPSEGKSTTSIALACNFARSGRKTVLVDADLRKPAIAHHFNAGMVDTGFADILLYPCPDTELPIITVSDGLDILPMGKIPPNPAEILSGQALVNFVASVRQKYDIVILDSAPVINLADAPLIARLADQVLFMVEAGRTHLGQARISLRRIASMARHEPVVILTRYKPLSASEDDYSYHTEYGTSRPL